MAMASYMLLREKAWGPPIGLSIETTNLCNIRCRHCRHSAAQEHFVNGMGTMSLDTFKAIVDILPRAWHKAVCVLGRDGEPLLNKNIEDYIAYFKERTGTTPGLGINGTLLTRSRASSLLDAGLREIRCDLCADEGFYNDLRQGADRNAVRDNLRGFLEVASEKGVAARLHVGDIHADTFPTRAEQIEALDMTRALFADCPGSVSVYKVVLFSSFGYYDEVSYPGGPAYSYCHEPWLNFVVDFAGRAVACCRDLRSEYVLGDVLESGFEALWNGERARALRRAIGSKHPEHIPACAQCDMPRQGGFTGQGHPVSRVWTHVRRELARRARRLAGLKGDIYW
jgi:radical SAM protein with 4Fe4S-binding SPASM domain